MFVLRWTRVFPSRMRYEEGHRVLLLQMIILVITVLIQTIKPERRLTLVAPVFFLLGLSVGKEFASLPT